MLKTQRDKELWMITQPDHASVAGYLAAHWGNENFAHPGYFATSADPERLRAETVLAIAQHDNGWWEWEATPELSDFDGLPLHLSDVLKNQEDGMNRWRLGIPRFGKGHPYVSLLISFHTYWLYAHSYQADSDPAFIHPLFWKGSQLYHLGDKNIKNAKEFVSELERIQSELTARLGEDPGCASWIESDHLYPNARLLQLLDGLSLSLCSKLIPPRKGEAKGFGEDEFDLNEVPRKSWHDRVTITLKPQGDTRITCEPYPFDVDPLPLLVPTRIFRLPLQRTPSFPAWWHAHLPQLIRYEYCSA